MALDETASWQNDVAPFLLAVHKKFFLTFFCNFEIHLNIQQPSPLQLCPTLKNISPETIKTFAAVIYKFAD